MKTAIITAAGLCVAAGTAVADATWVPGSSYVEAWAYDGGNNGAKFNYFDAFGNYTVSDFGGDGSATTTLDWDANGAHSDFSAIAGSGSGGTEQYLARTYLRFTAVTGGDFDVDIEFNWQGSGEDSGGIQTALEIYDSTGFNYTAYDTIYSSGTVSTTYTGTLVAGRDYQMYMYAIVAGTDVTGVGSGSADVTLTSIPLPTASALAGLGLLGLGVRRRRGSL